ncbi:MAG: DUF1700 domain-containing protein [Oscillospiraceae bacterium]|nr:DUF1700 domain-containing protein [Oscillospiraceae bacterium]
MTKIEFVLSLHQRLSALPSGDVKERLIFYSEMIEDRMEEGLSEEAAVASIGSVDVIAAQIIEEFHTAKLNAKQKKRLRAGEILLLVLGSPLWISLLVAAFAVVLSVYVSLWAIIISLWTVFGSLIGVALGGIVGGVIFAMGGNLLKGIALAGVAIACLGLSIFLYYSCKAATKGMAALTKKAALGIKNRFSRGEEAL